MKKFKIPKFKNKDEEREFWSRVDLSEYYQSESFEKANEINVPYQSLIKQHLKKAVFGG